MAEAEGKEEIVVFSVLTATECSECAREIDEGDYVRVEADKPLCMECADLDRLVFLPSGDTALTRRSKKGSRLWAVVLRFNRRRKRYERFGMLVEPAALEAAESSCQSDAGARAAARERAVGQRAVADEAYRREFGEMIASRYPGCPSAEAAAIAGHACEKYSGRVGRSARAKEFDPKAIDLAVRAHIRHEHTPYDDLLLRGVERMAARAQIAGRIDEVSSHWRRG